MKKLSTIIVSLFVAVIMPSATFAAATPTLNQTINNGLLSTDILDASQTPVGSPSFSMSAKSTSFACQTSTGTLGADAQRLYIINNGQATTNGWTLTMAATSGGGATWTSGGNSFDFNDTTGSGCTDGIDTDSKGGQLTVDPSAGTEAADCTSCTTTGVTKGTSTAFVEGTTDSVTLLAGSSAVPTIWRGYLTGATLSQTIPAATPSGTYTINMTLTATAI